MKAVHRPRTLFPIAIKKLDLITTEVKIRLTLSEALWVLVVVSCRCVGQSLSRGRVTQSLHVTVPI